MKLYYFDAYGRAEPIRLLLNHAGVEYEDVRYSFAEWGEIKPTGKFEFGCMPALEKDGKIMGMSGAIMKYLAVSYDLYPTDPDDVYQVEKLFDLVGDYFTGLFKMQFAGDAKEKMLEEYVKDFFPKYLGYFDKHLENNSSKEFMVGDKATAADFLILHLVERMANSEELKESVGPILDNFPTLKGYFETRYEAQKAYFEARPDCKF